jgi:hypothetical protein
MSLKSIQNAACNAVCNTSANPVAQAIDFLGGDSAVAQRAGLKTAWAVSKWRNRLPSERVLWLALQTGWRFTPHLLAPNLYPNPDDGMPQKGAA